MLLRDELCSFIIQAIKRLPHKCWKIQSNLLLVNCFIWYFKYGEYKMLTMEIDRVLSLNKIVNGETARC